MTKVALGYMKREVTLPPTATPAWAERVPRWQQMDAVSWAVTEAWYSWFGGSWFGSAGKVSPAPDLYLLASRGASGLADLDFARGGAFSPQRFVATLPSVVLSPVLQLSGWVGPVLCVQAGARTLAGALAEAALLCASGSADRVDVVNVEPGGLENPAAAERTVVVRYLEVRGRPDKNKKMFIDPSATTDLPADEDIYRWLDAPVGHLGLLSFDERLA